LQKRHEKLVMAHSNSTASLSAGVKALNDGVSSFAHTQSLWRFLNNEKVTPECLSEPLVEAAHTALVHSEGDFVLCLHDWSRVNYGGHRSKKDRLQMTHKTDIGYELQSSLLVDGQKGRPLSVIAQNLVSAEGVWQSRAAKIQPNNQTHLDELSERIDWIERQRLSKRLVHIVDREADSVAHLRQWSSSDAYWLVRVKAGSTVSYKEANNSVAEVADQLSFKRHHNVVRKGQPCTQWIASAQVILARPAKSKRLDVHGKRMSPVVGAALPARLIISKIMNEDGDEVARWYLLSNVPDPVDDPQIAWWYYLRWEIESFFKLLKSAGHQLESWEQETARATFNRVLIATHACVIAWHLLHSEEEKAVQARQFLVRLSGRQMKRSKPVTFPALLSGLFILLTMLETLENHSIEELKEYAQFVKNQFKYQTG